MLGITSGVGSVVGANGRRAGGRAGSKGRRCSFFKRPFTSGQPCVDRKSCEVAPGRAAGRVLRLGVAQGIWVALPL